MTHDPHRPIYHFTTDNRMNDPIPFFWDGVCHIFFQHNPQAPTIGTNHWGHAASRDLVHWEKLPIALSPTPGGPDADGCWTGSVVRQPHALGQFHMFYTGIPKMGKDLPQVQCMASSDDLVTWRKYAHNPVIAERPAGFGLCFRDPNLWREDDGWCLMVGGEQPEGRGGAALLYHSTDLTTWRYLHPMVLGRADQTAYDFECPDLFALKGPTARLRHVLLTSRHRVHYQVGTYQNKRFTAERLGQCDVGGIDGPQWPAFPDFYAAKTLEDAAGRRLMFGWLVEQRSEAERLAAGWSGALSLPRELGLTADDRLTFAVPEELRALRGKKLSDGARTLAAGTHILPDVLGDALELKMRLRRPTGTVRIALRATADLAEKAELIYDPKAQTLNGVPLELPAGTAIDLHIFIDKSVVEAFGNKLACVTMRTYPTRPAEAVHVAVTSDEPVEMERLEAWEMA